MIPGYYSNGENVYYVGNFNGQVFGLAACPVPPPPTTPPPSPTTPPPSPTTTQPPSGPEPFSFSLSVVGLSVNVSWDTSINANTLSIYRSEDGGESYVLIIDNLLTNASPYVDSTVLSGGEEGLNYYTYYMVSYSEAGSYTASTQTIGI